MKNATFPMKLLYKWIKNGWVILPDHKSCKYEQKAKIIFSLLNKDIPMVTMKDSDNMLTIIDGQHVIATIVEFINNEFEILYDGYHIFNSLPKSIQNSILYTTINFKII